MWTLIRKHCFQLKSKVPFSSQKKKKKHYARDRDIANYPPSCKRFLICILGEVIQGVVFPSLNTELAKTEVRDIIKQMMDSSHHSTRQFIAFTILQSFPTLHCFPSLAATCDKLLCFFLPIMLLLKKNGAVELMWRRTSRTSSWRCPRLPLSSPPHFLLCSLLLFKYSWSKKKGRVVHHVLMLCQASRNTQG